MWDRWQRLVCTNCKTAELRLRMTQCASRVCMHFVNRQVTAEPAHSLGICMHRKSGSRSNYDDLLPQKRNKGGSDDEGQRFIYENTQHHTCSQATSCNYVEAVRWIRSCCGGIVQKRFTLTDGVQSQLHRTGQKYQGTSRAEQCPSDPTRCSGFVIRLCKLAVKLSA